jgi:cytosine deaminase
LDASAPQQIDAGGNLVTPSFVNPHTHLCKVFTLPMMSEAALEAYQRAGTTGAAGRRRR